LLHTRFESGKQKILLYSWLPMETHHENMAIWNAFFFFNFGQIWAIFFMKNLLNMPKLCFWNQNLAKISQ
jgi:hypothetical protein